MADTTDGGGGQLPAQGSVPAGQRTGYSLPPLPPGTTLAAGGAQAPRRGPLGWRKPLPRPAGGRTTLVAVPCYRRTASLTLENLGWRGPHAEPAFDPDADIVIIMNYDDPTPDLLPGRTLRVEARNIGEARQHALDYARDFHYEVLHLLDDDLLVFPSTAPRERVLPSEYWGLLESFASLVRLSDGPTLLGAALRYRAWTMEHALVFNTGVVAHATIHVPRVPDECRYDRLPVYEDADFCLQILRAGLETAVCKNIQIENRAYTKKNKPPVDSGCNTYRGSQLNNDAQNRLRELHPGFIGPMVDPFGDNPGRIHWSKAAAAGRLAAGLLA